MERAAQFRDGERVDSSTGTAERLDAVKRDRSRCRRAGATGGDGRMRVQWGLSQRACPSTGAFLNGRRASTAGFRTLQVKPQSREARLWLVLIIFHPFSGGMSKLANMGDFMGNLRGLGRKSG